jgi:hypothetical protein
MRGAVLIFDLSSDRWTEYVLTVIQSLAGQWAKKLGPTFPAALDAQGPCEPRGIIQVYDETTQTAFGKSRRRPTDDKGPDHDVPRPY